MTKPVHTTYPSLMGTILEPSGVTYPESRLSGSYRTPHGFSLYLQLIEVKVENDLQLVADPEFDDEYTALGKLSYQDGHLETVEINGRTYVVSLTPFNA